MITVSRFVLFNALQIGDGSRRQIEIGKSRYLCSHCSVTVIVVFAPSLTKRQAKEGSMFSA